MRLSRTTERAMPDISRYRRAQRKPSLIFDNSAINRLADDPERSPLQEGIRAGFWFRLAEPHGRGLERAMAAHEGKIEDEQSKPHPHDKRIPHWRSEIEGWKRQIERLTRRLRRE
jgi:hypothetical protein